MDLFSSELNQSISRVESLWKQIGWTTDEQEVHRKSLFDQLSQVIEEFEETYSSKKHDIICRIGETIDHIQEVCEELGSDAKSFFTKYSSEPLLKQLSNLENCLSELQMDRNKRKITIKEKQKLVQSLHSELGFNEEQSIEQIKKLSNSVPILSNEVFDRYEYHISECQKRKSQIDDEVKIIISDLNQLVILLDWQSSFAQRSDEPLFKYHDRLINLLTDLEATKEARQLQLDEFKQKMESLWKSLEKNPSEEFDNFMEAFEFAPLSEQVLQEAEITICNLKETFHENLSQLLTKYRSSICSLWEKLCQTDEQHKEWENEFYSKEIDNLSDDVLQELLREHVNYEQNLKKEWDEVASIFKAINHRDQFLKKKEEQEIKARTDPNRLQGRGGQLLKEEQERKKIAREIKKSELFLRKEIADWESQHSKTFIYNGVSFLSTLCEEQPSSTVSSLKRSRPTSFTKKDRSTTSGQPPVKVARTAVTKTPRNVKPQSNQISKKPTATPKPVNTIKSVTQKPATVKKPVTTKRPTTVQKSNIQKSIPSSVTKPKTRKLEHTPIKTRKTGTKSNKSIVNNSPHTISNISPLLSTNSSPSTDDDSPNSKSETCPIPILYEPKQKKFTSSNSLQAIVDSIPKEEEYTLENEDSLLRLSPTTPTFRFTKRTKTPRKPLSQVNGISTTNRVEKNIKEVNSAIFTSSLPNRSTLHVRSKRTGKERLCAPIVNSNSENQYPNMSRLT